MANANDVQREIELLRRRVQLQRRLSSYKTRPSRPLRPRRFWNECWPVLKSFVGNGTVSGKKSLLIEDLSAAVTGEDEVTKKMRRLTGNEAARWGHQEIAPPFNRAILKCACE
jgi:hypothetical protein